MLELSNCQQFALEKVFPEKDINEVKELIEKNGGNSIPFCENKTPTQMDRIRFAIIKLSDGDISKLVNLIEFANSDWRDLLMSAGFGEGDKAHDRWYKNELKIKTWWQFW